MSSTILKPVLNGTKEMGPNTTNDAYIDRLTVDSEAGVVIANVTFTPGARTRWHIHEKGQVIKVLQGNGWICDRGGEKQRIEIGDVVWCKPGTEHWHGADEGSVMTHFVVGLGKAEWLEEVSEEDYRRIAGAETKE